MDRELSLDPYDMGLFLSIADILSAPDFETVEIWQGEIFANCLVGVSGKWGDYKTFLTQALCVHIIAGKPFLNRRTLPTEIFYFDLENPELAWRSRLPVLGANEQSSRFHLMPLFHRAPPPVFTDTGIRYYLTLAEIHRGALFVFDSLVRFYPSGRQSESTEDAVATMSVLRQLTRFVTVLFLHHPTKNGDAFRGSGDLQASPDKLYTLTNNKRLKTLKLDCIKDRFSEQHEINIAYAMTENGFEFSEILSGTDIERRNAEDADALKLQELIAEAYAQGQSSVRALYDLCRERFHWGRPTVDALLLKYRGQLWEAGTVGRKLIYRPLYV